MNKEPFVFKGRRGSLHVILDPNAALDVIKERLHHRLTEAGHFFRGAELIIELGERELNDEERVALAAVVDRHAEIRLVGFMNGTGQPLPAANGGDAMENQRDDGQAPGNSSLFLHRTIRAGQSIRHNGNITIVGDVNPGAEVVAAGHIVVLGVFRGTAHAGAAGDQSAIVAAYRLLPTQLRIANLVARAPDDEPFTLSEPEVAHIRDNTIVIEPYHHVK